VDLKDIDLFGVVSQHSVAIKMAVKDWGERYEANQISATAEFFTLLVKASGCEYVVTAEEVDEGAVDELVQRLTELAKQDGVVDPFAGRGGRKFQESYEEMWDKAVREAHTRDFLFDDFFMDKVVNLTTAMSCSVIRSFRHAATVGATQLVTSWIDVMKTLMEARDTAQRQLAAEDKKAKGGRPTERAATLKRTLELSHKHTQDLQSVISNVFQAVFAHRFRDVAPAVRSCVIGGIGCWVCSLPTIYLKDQFLKYLAWALSDKDAEVRKSGVAAVEELYSDERNVSSLEGFTERFRQRFVELTYDVDSGVAAAAVRLLMRLLEVQAISWDKVYEVCGLLMEANTEIRHATADLVAYQVQELGAQQLQGVSKGKKAKATKASEEDEQLAGLLHVLRELSKSREAGNEDDEALLPASKGSASAAEPLETETIAYVVDAMQDRMPVLTDWNALTGALVEDSAGTANSEVDSCNLLNVYVAAIRRACGTLDLPAAGGAAAGKKALPAKARNQMKESQKEATLVLMRALPKLMRKFQSNHKQVVLLVCLVKEMRLDLFLHKRDEKGFEAMLQVIVGVFGKHSDEETVLQCITTLNYCVDNGEDMMQDRAQLALNKCLEDMRTKLLDGWARLGKLSKKDLASAVAAAEEGDVDPVLFSTQAALMRLYHLQMCSSKPLAALEELNKVLCKLLEFVVKGKPLTTGIIQYALLNRFAGLLWAFHGLRSADRDDAAAIDAFVITRDDFHHQLMAIGEVAHDHPLCSTVFQLQSDLYLLLGRACRGEGLPEEVGYSPTDDDLIKYWALGRQIITHTADDVVDEEAEASGARAGLSPVEALIHTGKLLTNGVVNNPSWLTGQLVSYLSVIGNEAKEVVKDLLLGLDKERQVPTVYLDSLQAAWGRVEEASEDDYEQAAKQVQSLSARVMQMYCRPTEANQQAVCHIMRGGIRFACLDLPSRAEFLGYGLGHFIGRLSPENAAAVSAHLVKEAAPALKKAPEQLELVDNFNSHLEARAAEEDGGEGAMEEGDEDIQQPTEEQLFVGRPSGARKRPAEGPPGDEEEEEEEEELGEAPPRPMRRRR